MVLGGAFAKNNPKNRNTVKIVYKVVDKSELEVYNYYVYLSLLVVHDLLRLFLQRYVLTLILIVR